MTGVSSALTEENPVSCHGVVIKLVLFLDFVGWFVFVLHVLVQSVEVLVDSHMIRSSTNSLTHTNGLIQSN